MKTLFLVALLFGLCQLSFISENVVIENINTISTSRSKCLVTFVIDLKPFERFIEKLSHDIITAAGLAQEIMRQYDKPGKENFMNTFFQFKT